MKEGTQSATVKKVFLRLMPILFISYILAYIDRINIGFAALKMNTDLGISPYIYGLGAGVFFLGYFIFEIPSNLMLEKTGARRWIARIMISWGAISACMAFIQGPTSFIIVRFLLGVAEAGFFPGVILYLTYWFPLEYRARIIAAFMVAIPVSLAVGAPLSTAILQMDGIAGLTCISQMDRVPARLLCRAAQSERSVDADSPIMSDAAGEPRKRRLSPCKPLNFCQRRGRRAAERQPIWEIRAPKE